MKLKKALALLSAITMMATGTVTCFPASSSAQNTLTADAADITPQKVNVAAAETTEDGWSYTVSSNQVTITGYTGTETNVKIPAAIADMPVTGIGSKAFSGNTVMTSLDLGTVQKLGHHMVEGCTRLTKLTIPKSVSAVDYGGYNYYGCLSGSSVETLTFEEGIENIPAYIAKNASKLKNVVLPEKKDTTDGYVIGTSAFEGTSLETITLPESLTAVNDSAFNGCDFLKSIVIPDNVTYVGSFSFANCKRLQSLTLGKRVAKLGNRILSNSISLKELTIPKNLKETDHNGYNYNGCLEGSSVETIIFEKGIENIPAYICKGAASLTKAVIPEKEDVIDGYEIGACAFEGTALSELVLPNSITAINDYAFRSCNLLTEVTVPDNVKYVGCYSFANCKRLNKLTLGRLITKLGHHLVSASVSLKELTIPKNVREIDHNGYNYNGCLEGSSVETVIFAEGIENIPDYICKGASALSKIVLPEKEDVTNGYVIGTSAFEGTALVSVTLPKSLTSINDSAFCNCELLTECAVPENVKYVGSYSFANCKHLSALTLGSGVTKLGHHMVSGSISLKELMIPKTVNEVDHNGYNYSGCLTDSSIESVIFEEGIENIPAYICKGASALKSVVIPEKNETIDGYAIGASAFESTPLEEIVLPKSLTSINDSAFRNCEMLTKCDVPENVTYVGSYCFADCKRLTELTLGDGVKKLGHHILSNSIAMKEITIPKNVTEIDHNGYNYSGCLQGSSVETVKFAEGITVIPSYICKNAEYVKSVVIPEKEDAEIDGYAIGISAFEGTALSEVHLPDSLTSLNDYAFRNCAQLSEIVVPDHVFYVGSYSFADCKRLKSLTLGKTVRDLGHHILSGSPMIKEFTIPKSVKAVDHNGYNYSGTLSGSAVETLYLEDGITAVPAYLAKDCTTLKTVYLPESCDSIEASAFANCKNLFSIVSDRTTFMFQSSSFTNCEKLNDSRLTVFDLNNTSLTANADQASVDGIVSYTLKYKLMPSLTGNVTNRKLTINIPEQLTLLMDSVQSKNLEIDGDKIKNGSIPINADEGEIRFSARVTQVGSYTISASMQFKYNNSDWKQSIGSLDVECPQLTVAVPETVNDLTANVYGMAQKGQAVFVYVNDTLAGTITANEFTGRYQGAVKLPAGKNGDIYTIYAKTGETVSETVQTVYAAEKPVIKQVIFRYNQHSDYSKTLDITDVLLRGVSPVVSFNPAYQTSYEITATNNEKIDRMFVTSTKGGSEKYLEAFYDAATGKWIASGYFDPANRSYVPGTLNISIMEKKTEVLDENYDYAGDQKFTSVPDGFQENSSVEIISQNNNTVLSKVNVSDGVSSESFQMYSSENSEGVYVDGTFIKKQDIVKNPEKYGFKQTNTQTITDGKKADYYIRVAQNDDIAATILLESGNAVGTLGDIWSGATLLEIIEGDAADHPVVKFANGFITETASEGLELMFGSGYSNIANGLSFGSDVLTYAGQMQLANGDTEYEVLSTVLFAAKCFNNFGGTELVLGMCGIEPPFSTMIKVGIDMLLDYADDALIDWIKSGRHFFGSGHIRFIIDPSGVVCEAVLGNTIEGATVTVYYQDPKTGEAVKWNAADYDQLNPLLTDEEGQYLWDVPEGKWKVVCTKDGYDTVESEWMDIPPVRTNVNLFITSKDAPALTAATLTNEGLTVQFSKFIDISTVSEKALILNGFEGDVTIKAQLLNDGDLYADTFLLTGDFTDALKSVSVTKDVRSYAGTAAAESTLDVKDERFARGDVNCDYKVNLKDVTLIRRYIAGGWDVDVNKALADVNRDGNVNLKDVTLLRRYIAGGWNVTLQ